jgi:hypothetical protein
MTLTIRDPKKPRPSTEFLPGLRLARSERQQLTGKDLEKARGHATEVLSSVFEHYLPKMGLACLEEAYDLQMRTFAFKERLAAFEMEPVFQIMTSFNTAGFINGSPLGAPISVLLNPSGVTVDQIRASNLFYRTYGGDDGDLTVLQDLDWSATLLENSSAATLRNQIFERLIDVPGSERGGPLVYKIMMDIVPSIRPEAIETLVTTLRSIPHFAT